MDTPARVPDSGVEFWHTFLVVRFSAFDYDLHENGYWLGLLIIPFPESPIVELLINRTLSANIGVRGKEHVQLLQLN